jgi:hypothetical protein
MLIKYYMCYIYTHMFRNLVALLLLLTVLCNNYKLNYIECLSFYFICASFIVGNFGFYFLEWYPNNPAWNFIINGGHYWHEFPVTMTIMITFMIYQLFTNKTRITNKTKYHSYVMT